MSFNLPGNLPGVYLGPGEGPQLRVPGHPLVVPKLVGGDTGGAYSLLEVLITGEGPPQHIHNAEDEAFYVLEGEVNVLRGEETLHAVTGAFVLIPKGTAHTIWNAGSNMAAALAQRLRWTAAREPTPGCAVQILSHRMMCRPLSRMYSGTD